MATLFIADLHLSDERPDLVEAFLQFLTGTAAQSDGLYILGDLFETWIGDDEQSPLQQRIAAALLAFSQRGIPLYYIHGNRDFMIGQRYAKQAGMTILPPLYSTHFAGEHTLLLHGDLLCTDDIGYQKFRETTAKPWLRKLFLAMPLFVRCHISNRMRAGSKKGKKLKSAAIMDVSSETVIETFEQQQVTLMIHGHTHRPHIHTLQLANFPKARRIVLGDWNTELWYLRIDGQDIDLIHKPITPVSTEN